MFITNAQSSKYETIYTVQLVIQLSNILLKINQLNLTEL
jgi:hypothetical protein